MKRIFLAAIAGVGAALMAVYQADAADLARGQYLVEALAACDNCHTPRAADGYELSRRFAGGPQIFTERTYAVRGSNISADKETGVGGWSDDMLRASIVEGRVRGAQLAPAMPSESYRALTRSDLDAVIAFLRQAPPAQAQSMPPRRDGVWTPHPLPGAEAPFDEAALTDKIKRGLYVASIARCMACHSGESDDAPDHVNKLGAGGKIFRTPVGATVASNITAHVEKGVGAWSDDELKRAIKDGVSRDGQALKPPMSTLAKAHFARMSSEDIDALIAWLRTVPATE